MSAPTLVSHIDKLEAAGFVVRSRNNPADRRRVCLTVTEAGSQIVQTLRERRTAWLSTRLETLSLEALAAVAAAIEPANAAQLPASAASAAAPPFASTCRSFRPSPPFAAVVNKFDETKKARSRNKPRHPNPHTVARPIASAAAAPRRVSHLTRRTVPAARAS